MKVNCYTNLDLLHEQWPTELPSVPRVGDGIQSATVWGDGFQLILEVVAVTWKEVDYTLSPRIPARREWIPTIELHISTKPVRRIRMSVTDFYEWYAPLVGKTPSSFI